jgi:hypothetical protein
MMLNDIKDAIENSGHRLVAERKIAHGIQLILRGGTNINAFETGNFQVQGPNWDSVATMLNAWDEYLRLFENTAPTGLERLKRLDLSSVKRALAKAGFPILREKRFEKEGCTQLRLWGDTYVHVYDKGAYDVQGSHPNRVRAFMKAIRPWGETIDHHASWNAPKLREAS